MLPSRQEFRSILRKHLEENDPSTLQRWHVEGAVDFMLDAQADQAISVLKWMLGDDPYNHPNLNEQLQAKEFAIERLLDYQRT